MQISIYVDAMKILFFTTLYISLLLMMLQCLHISAINSYAYHIYAYESICIHLKDKILLLALSKSIYVEVA